MTAVPDRAVMARVLARVFEDAAERVRETKRAPLALSSVSLEGVFEGYASLFGVADLGRDVVEKGAFAASLAKRGPSRVKMLWQLDAGQPIGAWLAITEDARGLKVKGRLNLAVRRAREILALMREGQVDGLSIGFRTEQATQDRKTGLRHLQKIDLWEISLVTFPMLPQARVTAVKRAGAEHSASSEGLAFTSENWRIAAHCFEARLVNIAQTLERRYDPAQPRDRIGRWSSGGGADVRQGATTGTYGGPAGGDAVVTDECETQYELDSSLCRMLGSRFSRLKCWESAAERYSACLTGRPVLPLRF